MRRLVLPLCLATLAAGCGGSGDATLARVGGTAITQQQVDALVDHAREEARNEHRDFPNPGSDTYRELQREALGMLVYRAQVETAAQRRLGIVVTTAEARQAAGAKPPRHKDGPELVFERAIGALGIEEGRDEEAAARLEDARLHLTLAALVERLGGERVQAWVERVRREVPVAYADGWAPQGVA